MDDTRKLELLERHLNNAAIYTSNENFEEAFAVYEQATKDCPEMLAVWKEWLACCYQRIENECCLFKKEGAYDVSLMQHILEQVMTLSDEEGQKEAKARWNEFWINTADSAWAGAMSLFSTPPADRAYQASFETYTADLALAGRMHPHVAEVIEQGRALAAALHEEQVCIWQVEHLTVAPRERIFQMERGIKANAPLKSTYFDWFPLRPEFGTRLDLVLGRMCLSEIKAAEESQPTVGLLLYLTRAIPMEDVKAKEFVQYSRWRWNAMKTCPHCGAKLTGLFTRECGICHRDVKKMKRR